MKNRAQYIGEKLVLTASLLGLVSCGAFEAERFLDADVQRTGSFRSELAVSYKEVADKYAKRENWIAATYMSEKGVNAWEGETPPPGDPARRAVLKKDMVELGRARKSLLTTLRTRASRSPVACADAQVTYDDWLVRASSNLLGEGGSLFLGAGGPTETTMPEAAREAFVLALNTCAEKIVTYEPPPEMVVKEPKRTRKASKRRASKRRARRGRDVASFESRKGKNLDVVGTRTVYFNFASTSVDSAGLRILKGVARTLREYDKNRVELTGHTDTSGEAGYNNSLGKKRAVSAARALKKEMRRRSINIFTSSQGEKDLAVQTGDNVREPLNRRVEIVIKGE